MEKIHNHMGTNKDWYGIMRILSVEYICDGKVIDRQENIPNMLHFLGEAFLLNALFRGGNSSNSYIPTSYYLGLDSRPVLNVNDTMANVLNEPFVNGYTRQAVSSTTGFSLNVSKGVNQMSSQIVTFSAVGGNWGPVLNVFLSDKPNNTGTLISSAVL